MQAPQIKNKTQGSITQSHHHTKTYSAICICRVFTKFTSAELEV